jgi:hypothetical protein
MSCLVVVTLASWVMVVVSLLRDNKELGQWRICWGVDTIGALHSVNALHKKIFLIILNIWSFEIVFRETVVGMSLRDTKTKCSLHILLFQRLLEANRAVRNSFLFVVVDMKMA